MLHLKLKPMHRSGDIVLRTYNLAVGYPNRRLFSPDDIELRRLECAALIGPNGSGKTTFLKTILGLLSPLSGEVALGASLKIGYFAQAHEGLDPERTLVEEIEAVAPNLLLAEIRDHLGRFLFSGDEVFKKVAVLSGGERGRLALAKLVFSQANLLLLDEPTNHLDIPSQEILQQVLADFDGTILLVSHDRYLIDALATQIWEIDEQRGLLRLFKGDYSEYHLWLESVLAAERAAEPPKMEERRPRADNRAVNEARRRQARLKEVETMIGDLEARLEALSRRLENPPKDPGKVQKLGNEYVQLQNELDALMGEWESLHESLDI
jgi:ATP-binding cassette subfamily F protein 3